MIQHFSILLVMLATARAEFLQYMLNDHWPIELCYEWPDPGVRSVILSSAPTEANHGDEGWWQRRNSRPRGGDPFYLPQRSVAREAIEWPIICEIAWLTSIPDLSWWERGVSYSKQQLKYPPDVERQLRADVGRLYREQERAEDWDEVIVECVYGLSTLNSHYKFECSNDQSFCKPHARHCIPPRHCRRVCWYRGLVHTGPRLPDDPPFEP